MLRLAVLLIAAAGAARSQREPVQLSNSIEPEKRLYTYDPQELEKTERCWVEGEPLDMMFVVDASNSVGDKWPEQTQFIRDIVDTVAIGYEKTRVAVVQFSNNPLVRFTFNTYSSKKDVLDAVDMMRTTRGNSKLGKGLFRAMQEMNEESGMRGAAVPKVLFVVSDGRYTDAPDRRPDEHLPHDVTDSIREKFGFEIYAFGVGRPDWNALRKISRNPKYVVNSDNVTDIFTVFEKYMGVKVCQQLPVCTPGERKPLDLLYVVDSSGSVNDGFHTTVNFVRRTLSSINVHEHVVRVGLINYGPYATMDIPFNKLQNNDEVFKALSTLRPKGKTTKTRDALALAVDVFASNPAVRPLKSGESQKRLIILLTDGKASSHQSGAGLAQHLREDYGVDIIVVALGTKGEIDYGQLVALAGNNGDNVFIGGRNLVDFERTLYDYADRNCLGRDAAADGGQPLDSDPEALWMRPVSSQCTLDGLVTTITTKEQFHGQLFVIGHGGREECSATNAVDNFHLAASASAELKGRRPKIVVRRGTCGIQLKDFGDGTFGYEAAIGLRFHDKVFTGSDLTQHVKCAFAPKDDAERSTLEHAANPKNQVGRADLAKTDRLECTYTVTAQSRKCQLLDARVGDIIEHTWRCFDPHTGILPNSVRYLVHDCVAMSDSNPAEAIVLLSHDGCHADATLMGTPLYSKEFEHQSAAETTLQTYAFAFASSSAVRFSCMISVCDVDRFDQPCLQQVVHPRMHKETAQMPPKCFALPKQETEQASEARKRFAAPDELPNFDKVNRKWGFAATYAVSSRTINMLPPKEFTDGQLDFCSMLELK